jgi:hypothetical protein
MVGGTEWVTLGVVDEEASEIWVENEVVVGCSSKSSLVPFPTLPGKGKSRRVWINRVLDVAVLQLSDCFPFNRKIFHNSKDGW